MKIIDKVNNEEVASITNLAKTLEEVADILTDMSMSILDALAQIDELIDTEGEEVPNVIIYGDRYSLDIEG